jgi:hypothetical protein
VRRQVRPNVKRGPDDRAIASVAEHSHDGGAAGHSYVAEAKLGFEGDREQKR